MLGESDDVRRGPRLVAADVNPAAVLSRLDADELLVVVVTHVAELVLVPRVPFNKIRQLANDIKMASKCVLSLLSNLHNFPHYIITRSCT